MAHRRSPSEGHAVVLNRLLPSLPEDFEVLGLVDGTKHLDKILNLAP